MGGAFGHMHRHSVFNGLPPLPFPQMAAQQPQGFVGPQAFSPAPQGPSPLQVNALRQDLGFVRSVSPQFAQAPPPQPASQQPDLLAPLRSMLPQNIINDQAKLMQALNLLQKLQHRGLKMK